MSFPKKAKATAKNLEGKAQEAMGEVTGDPQDKVEGQAKQLDAQTRHAAENLKEELEDKKKEIQRK